MSTEKRDFDKEAASWDERPYRIKLAKDIADAVTRQIPVASDMDVMDFGCGTGLVTLRLQPLVRSITGVDSSQGMVDMLTKKIAEMGLGNVKAMLVDLDRGGTLTGSYDLIVSNMTLHHVRDIRYLLDQFHGILAPSGYLCIADLDLEDGQFHENNVGVFHPGFDRAELRKSFEDAGFDRIQDTSATTMTRQTRDGGMREFTIFLMSGHKRQTT